MFERTHNGLCWFKRDSDSYSDFKLIGMVLGIALYNNAILDFLFPLSVQLF